MLLFFGKSLEERRLHRGIALLKGYCHLDKNTFYTIVSSVSSLLVFTLRQQPTRHAAITTTTQQEKNALEKAGSIYGYTAYIRVSYYLSTLHYQFFMWQ